MAELRQAGDLLLDRPALALEKIRDRRAEAALGDPMRRMGRDGKIAALDLVLALAPASTRASLCSIA